jgi:hypothetical protein
MENQSMLVLHQCRQHEWDGDEPWAFKAAEKMRKQGFVVVRAPTENWWDLKQRQPELFEQKVYSTEPTARQQQLICTLNMTQVTVPLAEKLQALLTEEDWLLTTNTVKRWKSQHGVDLYLPIRRRRRMLCCSEARCLCSDRIVFLGC